MNIQSTLPRVSKHYLFLIAALVWTFAGGMLLFRGFYFNAEVAENWTAKLIFSLLSGLLFYALLFTRISKKHVLRIQNMDVPNPIVFAFFNLKSYLMMLSMIVLGISLRLSGAVSPEYLAMIYVTMGIPLLLSSFRFYTSFCSENAR